MNNPRGDYLFIYFTKQKPISNYRNKVKTHKKTDSFHSIISKAQCSLTPWPPGVPTANGLVQVFLWWFLCSVVFSRHFKTKRGKRGTNFCCRRVGPAQRCGRKERPLKTTVNLPSRLSTACPGFGERACAPGLAVCELPVSCRALHAALSGGCSGCLRT